MYAQWCMYARVHGLYAEETGNDVSAAKNIFSVRRILEYA